MHVAAYEGQTAVIRALRAAGAGLDTPSCKFDSGLGDGLSTPLHRAVLGGEVCSVETLLDLGACPHQRTQGGDQPAHGVNSNPALLILLLDAGTDPEAVNDLGRSVADAALSRPLLYDVMRSWLARASARSAIEVLDTTSPGGAP